MTDIVCSPRRIEHVRENSDKLFHDLFAACGNRSQNQVPWKDRQLPASFFQPPAESHDSPAFISQSAGVMHAYSRSMPVTSRQPYRHMPAANLWGPSKIPASNNGPVNLPMTDVSQEIHSRPITTSDPYGSNNAINNMTSTAYGSYEQRSQFYQQHPAPYSHHINQHVRQASLPYSVPRTTVNNSRYVNSTLKQQQSKTPSDWWPHHQQPSPRQYPAPNVSVSNPAVGPACQHWPSGAQESVQNQWPQDGTVSQEQYMNQGSGTSSLTPSFQSSEWSDINNAWPNSSTDVTAVDHQAQPQPQNQTTAQPLDDQRQQLLFFLPRLKEERDKMQQKIDELDRKIEDVMSALSVSSNPTNGYYTGGVSTPDDLVPSLQIEQGNSLVSPTQLENGNASSGWM